MGYTQRKIASVLDMSVGGVRYYSAGVRRVKRGGAAQKVEVPVAVLLACAAIEAGLPPIKE